MKLSDAQNDIYARQGFVTGLHAFDSDRAAALRAEIETLEDMHSAGAGGYTLNQFFRVNGHLVIPMLSRIARDTMILEQVSSVLGSNLLVWSVELFIKEPHSTSVVSWHQDLTYWGMGETDEELTAWIALSDVSEAAGCMRFVPRSHKGKIVPHHDTFDARNLLSRGQEIAGIDEAVAIHGPLKPGQMSFHHGRCFHASGPNRTDDRRIGCAVRYVTPEVKQAKSGRDYAVLVRGIDEVQGWINVAAPTTLFSPDDLARYDMILQHQSTTLAEGAQDKMALYKSTGE